MNSETANNSVPLDLPPNIHNLIDQSLEPATDLMKYSKNTEKYYIPQYPDLIVRLNKGDKVEDVEEALEATQRLSSSGIHVVPAQLVEWHGEAYVVVKKVQGLPLLEALKHGQTSELVDTTDQLLTMLVNVLSTSKEAGESVAADISNPDQYMFGTVSGDEIPKIWLTDLPQYIFDSVNVDNYATELLEIANGIIEIESVTGRQLTNARTKLEQAVAGSDDSILWGDGIRNATNLVLQTGVAISPAEEDVLERLNTK